MTLAEAVKYTQVFREAVINIKGNKNKVIFFKDKEKMLKELETKIKKSNRKVNVPIELIS